MRTYTHVAIIVGMGLHLAAMAILASLPIPVENGRARPSTIELVVDIPSAVVAAESTALAVRLDQDVPFNEFNVASELTSLHVRITKSSEDVGAFRRIVASETAFGESPSDKLDLEDSRKVKMALSSSRHFERLPGQSPKQVPRTRLVTNLVLTPTSIRRPGIEIIYSTVRKPKPKEVEEPVTDKRGAYDRLAKPLPGNPLPVFPAGIYFQGQGGVCKLEVHVNKFGQATSLRLIRSSGINWLDRSAVSAVAQWRFAPAIFNGSAAASLVNVPVVFSVNGN